MIKIRQFELGDEDGLIRASSSSEIGSQALIAWKGGVRKDVVGPYYVPYINAGRGEQIVLPDDSIFILENGTKILLSKEDLESFDESIGKKPHELPTN